jgi:hypothetical protein
MKTFVCIFFLILINVKSQAGSYHPFPLISGCWTYRYYDDFHVPTNQLNQYFLFGDSVISGVTYKIMNGGLIREAGKVIYFIPDTSGTEYILYNFNLNQGDTLFHPFGNSVYSDTVVVNYVDSVLTPNGYLRQLHFGFITWIEGVGSNFYLLDPMFVFGVSGNFQLECMQGDSVGVYPGSSCGYCPVGIPTITKSFNISIQPNPIHDKALLKIENSNCSEFFLSIFNVFGQKIKSLPIQNSNFWMNRIDMQSGLYLYSITNCENITMNGKFLIY